MKPHPCLILASLVLAPSLLASEPSNKLVLQLVEKADAKAVTKSAIWPEFQPEEQADASSIVWPEFQLDEQAETPSDGQLVALLEAQLDAELALRPDGQAEAKRNVWPVFQRDEQPDLQAEREMLLAFEGLAK